MKTQITIVRRCMALTCVIAIACAAPLAVSVRADADTIALLGGCFIGTSDWWATDSATGQSYGDEEKLTFCFGSEGGSGQTGGGVDDVVVLDVAFTVSSHMSADMPSFISVRVQGEAWINEACCKGYAFAGVFGDIGVLVSESTPYYLVTNEPGFVYLYDDDDNELPVAGVLEPGTYLMDASFGVGTWNQNPHVVDLVLRLVASKPGDMTGDGSVGVADLLLLLATWGACADLADCLADFNGDGVVGVADLLILLEQWG